MKICWEEPFFDYPSKIIVAIKDTRNKAFSPRYALNIVNFNIFFRTSLNTYLLNDSDLVSCTNGLYINVSHVFLPMQYIYSVINTLTSYLNVKDFPDDQYVSLTLSSPNGVASTLSFPGKSKSKLFSNSRQTIVWKKNGEYSSLITRHS